MTNWLLGIVLGIVQGVSEWLPVSSKTQVIIVSSFLFPGLPLDQAYNLGLFLEAGTFFAAALYFRREVWMVLSALVGRGTEEGKLLLKFLVIVTAITAVIGVGIYEFVSGATSGQAPALGFPMIALGCILVGDAILIRLARGRYVPRKGLKELSMTDIVVVGIAQGIAALPGVSRSGATVSAMLLLGIRPEESFRLSFLALIPASVGATGVTILLGGVDLGAVLGTVTLPVVALAILITIAIGVVFIRVLLKAASSRSIVILTAALGILAILSGASTILTGHG